MSASAWRQVTAVLYGNDAEWDAAQGGALRCYDEEDHTGSTWRDVVPIGGRPVLFWSARLIHEVLPTFAARYAITLWMMGV